MSTGPDRLDSLGMFAAAAALPDQLGPDVMALTRRVKDALDPQGILNPGAIL